MDFYFERFNGGSESLSCIYLFFLKKLMHHLRRLILRLNKKLHRLKLFKYPPWFNIEEVKGQTPNFLFIAESMTDDSVLINSVKSLISQSLRLVFNMLLFRNSAISGTTEFVWHRPREHTRRKTNCMQRKCECDCTKGVFLCCRAAGLD